MKKSGIVLYCFLAFSTCAFAGDWVKTTSTDEMEGTSTTEFTIKSESIELVVWCTSDSSDPRIAIGASEILDSSTDRFGSQATLVKLKFDNGPVEEHSFYLADDYTTIFPGLGLKKKKKQKLHRDFLEHDQVMIRVSVYQGGYATEKFDISGLADRLAAEAVCK